VCNDEIDICIYAQQVAFGVTKTNFVMRLTAFCPAVFNGNVNGK
jgi:hypothetical protein